MNCLVRVSGDIQPSAQPDYSAIADNAISLSGIPANTRGYVADLAFVSVEEIRELNKRVRNVDRQTDVLSFPSIPSIPSIPSKENASRRGGGKYPYDDETGRYFLGDVVICADIAARQADEYGHSPERELGYLFAHGMCHLLGYDHIKKADKARMRRLEEETLRLAGVIM